jgi:hypothetical protein
VHRDTADGLREGLPVGFGRPPPPVERYTPANLMDPLSTGNATRVRPTYVTYGPSLEGR